MSRRRSRSRSPSPRRDRERLPPPPPRRYEDAQHGRAPPDHSSWRGGGRDWDKDAHRPPPRSDRGYGYSSQGGRGEHPRPGGGHGGPGGHGGHGGPPQRSGGGVEWIGGDVKSYGVRLEPHPASLDADIEEGISATDFQEFRRLKRRELIKENRYCIWDNTPSPSVSPERGTSSDEEAVTAAHMDSGNAEAPLHGEATEAEALGDEGLSTKAVVKAQEEELVGPAAELDKQEAAILKGYLLELRIAADKAEEERIKAEEENAFVGPEMPHQAKAAANSYGKALLPGEGEAMAAFVQSGKRIPRRGEVGMTADQISSYEDLGYIMSGSRHSRMNAIRIRKENQVYTAEEKAALAQLNFEEKAKKEARVLNDMRKLVEQSVHGSGSTQEK